MENVKTVFHLTPLLVAGLACFELHDESGFHAVPVTKELLSFSHFLISKKNHLKILDKLFFLLTSMLRCATHTIAVDAST